MFKISVELTSKSGDFLFQFLDKSRYVCLGHMCLQQKKPNFESDGI